MYRRIKRQKQKNCVYWKRSCTCTGEGEKRLLFKHHDVAYADILDGGEKLDNKYVFRNNTSSPAVKNRRKIIMTTFNRKKTTAALKYDFLKYRSVLLNAYYAFGWSFFFFENFLNIPTPFDFLMGRRGEEGAVCVRHCSQHRSYVNGGSAITDHRWSWRRGPILFIKPLFWNGVHGVENCSLHTLYYPHT